MYGDLLERGVGYYLEYKEIAQDMEDVDGPLWTGNLNPGHVIGFTLGAAYVAWPLDFIPDYIPVVGYVDDALILNASTTLGGWVWDKLD